MKKIPNLKNKMYALLRLYQRTVHDANRILSDAEQMTEDEDFQKFSLFISEAGGAIEHLDQSTKYYPDKPAENPDPDQIKRVYNWVKGKGAE